MLRILLTGARGSDLRREVLLEFVASGHVVREFQGPVTDQAVVDRQVRHVEAIVHTDWLDRGRFESLVDHNLGGTIHLAVASERTGIPLFLYLPADLPSLAQRTVDMARQVAEDEYGAIPVPEGEEIERLVRIFK